MSGRSLKERVAALEARVAALEAEVGAGASPLFQPIIITGPSLLQPMPVKIGETVTLSVPAMSGTSLWNGEVTG